LRSLATVKKYNAAYEKETAKIKDIYFTMYLFSKLTGRFSE